MEAKEKLQLLAKDLSKEFPSSPRELLGGFVIAKRALDKCRAELNGSNGEYHFDCPLDNMFFDFAGITGEQYKELIASGATDEEVAKWVQEHSNVENIERIKWNNKMRDMRLSDLPENLQEYMEGYIPNVIPKNKIVYHFFDVYDIEEQRI
jgi:hypothetical protein